MTTLAPARLRPGDAERYARLRLRMLLDTPWAFSSSPEDDLALDPGHLASILAADQNALIAIEAEEELVASAGIARDKNLKSAHRATLWGVFVEPRYRGRGLGRVVVSAAIDLARTWEGVDYVDLGVSENAPAAHALYQSLGFRAWGRQPEMLRCGEQRYDEIFMCLRLS